MSPHKHDEISPAAFHDLAWNADLPLACVWPDTNTFAWANHAFERLVGFSIVELQQITWQAISKPQDIGDDLRGVDAVISGRIPSYSMEKRYLHKLGHEISIRLTVWRYPMNHSDPVALFLTEARPSMVEEIHEVKELKKMVLACQRKLQTMEEEHFITINNRTGDDVGGDQVGRNKTTNSDQAIKLMTGAVMALGVIVAWLAYYVASIANRVPPTPPPAPQLQTP